MENKFKKKHTKTKYVPMIREVVEDFIFTHLPNQDVGLGLAK